MKRIGWVGYVEDKPYFEQVTDNYVENGGTPVPAVNIYQRKKDALRRFEEVREVFVK